MLVAEIKLPVESIEAITVAPYLNWSLPPDSVIVKLAVEKEPPVTILPANEPFESLATMVEAPFAEAAVVRAFATVPLEMLEALIAVKATPLPETLVKVPVAAVNTLAAKEPLESLATMVEAPLADAAVVLAFEMVPDEMFDALMSDNPAPLPL